PKRRHAHEKVSGRPAAPMRVAITKTTPPNPRKRPQIRLEVRGSPKNRGAMSATIRGFVAAMMAANPTEACRKAKKLRAIGTPGFRMPSNESRAQARGSAGRLMSSHLARAPISPAAIANRTESSVRGGQYRTDTLAAMKPELQSATYRMAANVVMGGIFPRV